MSEEEVPDNFPQEPLGGVPGAQPKLLVQKGEHGQYVDSAAASRTERWAICADLCEQLSEYVKKHWTGEGPRAAYIERVLAALESKKSQWGISRAEADWISARVRAALSQETGSSER